MDDIEHQILNLERGDFYNHLTPQHKNYLIRLANDSRRKVRDAPFLERDIVERWRITHNKSIERAENPVLPVKFGPYIEPDVFYNIKTIPLLPKIPRLTGDEWRRLGLEYPVTMLHKDPKDPSHHYKKFSPEGYEINYNNEYFRTHGYLGSQLARDKHKTIPISIFSGRNAHSIGSKLLPDGTVQLWDPLGEYSNFIPHAKYTLMNDIGDTNMDNVSTHVQGERGVCGHWTNLYCKNPELSPDDFQDYILTAIRESGLDSAFPGHETHEYGDLLMIALMKAHEGHNPYMRLTDAERTDYRSNAVVGRAKPKKKRALV
jgi:hypothetical protein